MPLFAKFSDALPYTEFMARFGTPVYDAKWRDIYAKVQLTAAQRDLLVQFKRETNVLVLAGAWCGDCSGQCPIFDRFAEAAPVLKIRYLDRDAHPEVQQELQINGGNRVPVVVFFNEDGQEVTRYGERTLSKYRALAATQVARVARPASLRPATRCWLRSRRIGWMNSSACSGFCGCRRGCGRSMGISGALRWMAHPPVEWD